MSKRIFIILFIIFHSSLLKGMDEFRSDGCSMYLDGIPLFNPNKWYHCCFIHDLSYWPGGEEGLRVGADSELKQCVGEVTFYFHGLLMEFVVKLAGGPGTGFSWQWGFGNSEIDDYKKINKDEIKSIYDNLEGVALLISKLPEKYRLNTEQMDYVREEYHKFSEKVSEEANLPLLRMIPENPKLLFMPLND